MFLKLNIFYCFLFFTVFVIKAQEEDFAKIKISRKAEKTYSKEKMVKKVVKDDTTLVIPFQVFGFSRRISNYIKEIPDSCEENRYEISAKCMGNLMTVKVVGNMFSIMSGMILYELKPGDFFYIDNIHTKCAKTTKKLYKILLQ
jgi:hypothetical protein